MEMIDVWIKALKEDKLPNLDQSIARAVCHWPLYIKTIKEVESDKALQEKLVNKIKNTPFTKELDWHNVLLILLSSALGGDYYSDIHPLLFNIYKLVDSENEPHFYYLFTASFQGWVIYHIFDKRFSEKRCKHGLCYSCKANIPRTKTEPTLLMLDIFYRNFNKTYTSFKTIFGIGTTDKEFLKVTTYFKEPIKNELYGEFKKLIDDIRNLVFVHSRLRESEKIVTSHLMSETKHEKNQIKNEWKKLWTDYIEKLKLVQLSCFVKTARSDEMKGGIIKYKGTKELEEYIGALPTFDYEKGIWDFENKRLSVFYDIIGKIYGEGFKEDFFTNLFLKSPTDVEKAMGIIFIPDGEITFFHILYVVRRLIEGQNASFKGKNALDSEEIQRNRNKYYDIDNGTIDWNRSGWWIKEGTLTQLIKEVFATDKNQMSSKCSALISYLYLIEAKFLKMKKDRKSLNATQQSHEKIIEVFKETFCEFSNPEEVDPFKWLEKVVNDLKDRFTVDKNGYKQVSPELILLIESSRVEFLPEIILRKGDSESHTLFFMPSGIEENTSPLTIIAGTIRGVEDNYLPFSTYRSLAHVYPLFRIFNPIITYLTKQAWDEISKERILQLGKEEEYNRAIEIQQLFDHIKEPMDAMIDDLNKAAKRASAIRLSTAPILDKLLFFSKIENIATIFDNNQKLRIGSKLFNGIHDLDDRKKDGTPVLNLKWLNNAFRYICSSLDQLSVDQKHLKSAHQSSKTFNSIHDLDDRKKDGTPVLNVKWFNNAFKYICSSLDQLSVDQKHLKSFQQTGNTFKCKNCSAYRVCPSIVSIIKCYLEKNNGINEVMIKKIFCLLKIILNRTQSYGKEVYAVQLIIFILMGIHQYGLKVQVKFKKNIFEKLDSNILDILLNDPDLIKAHKSLGLCGVGSEKSTYRSGDICKAIVDLIITQFPQTKIDRGEVGVDEVDIVPDKNGLIIILTGTGHLKTTAWIHDRREEWGMTGINQLRGLLKTLEGALDSTLNIISTDDYQELSPNKLADKIAILQWKPAGPPKFRLVIKLQG